mmetsp:Transcript_52626/g.124301  ORF Transcript_52626/g.124301 Transcript_52626/m.124301 type:complete len:560 (+) Transcript_52626:168-1847(+)
MARMISSRKMAVSTVLVILMGMLACTVVANLPPLVKNPNMLQLNTRVIVHELQLQKGKKKASLDDFPESEIDGFKEAGFDIVQLGGVWQTGMFGMQRALKTIESDPLLTEDMACSSPYAIVEYKVHDDFGGDAALARLREKFKQRGIRLFLDFVPNHVAVDHPWTAEKPDYLVAGSDEDLANEPQNYFRVGERVLAHGRDPYFDGWEDTAQLNYGHGELRSEMCKTLAKIATMCDGVRCDMAMLQCPDIMEQTWGGRLNPADGSPRVTDPFWPGAIKAAKAANKNFILMAEVYWGRDFELQESGFAFTYDKALYDRVVALQGDPVRLHLTADLAFQSKCIRYLESHDEERAATVLSDVKSHDAAAILAFTCPGIRSFHDGQLQGRKKRVSMHVRCRLHEPRDPQVSLIYAKLLGTVLKRPEVRDGTWTQCHTSPSMDQNPSWMNMVAHCCWDDRGHAMMVVVNFGGDHSNGHVVIPPQVKLGIRSYPIPPTMNYTITEEEKVQELGSVQNAAAEVMLNDIWSHESYTREAKELLGEHGGMWFDMKPWQTHVFDLSLLTH